MTRNWASRVVSSYSWIRKWLERREGCDCRGFGVRRGVVATLQARSCLRNQGTARPGKITDANGWGRKLWARETGTRLDLMDHYECWRSCIHRWIAVQLELSCAVILKVMSIGDDVCLCLSLADTSDPQSMERHVCVEVVSSSLTLYGQQCRNAACLTR